MYQLLTGRWSKFMANFFFGEVEVKKTQKERGQYENHLDRTSLVNKGFIM